MELYEELHMNRTRRGRKVGKRLLVPESLDNARGCMSQFVIGNPVSYMDLIVLRPMLLTSVVSSDHRPSHLVHWWTSGSQTSYVTSSENRVLAYDLS